MILSVGAFVRVGGLLLLAVVLQLSALSQIGILGGHADVVVLVVAAVAFYGGASRARRPALPPACCSTCSPARPWAPPRWC